MKRIFAVLIVLLAPVFSSFSVDEKKFSITKIVIDPGHGGHDTGCLGGNSREKDVTLSIALRLGKYIEENFSDVQVIYTRKTDVFVELHERAEIANSNKADIFICIHCNSGPREAYGTETYVMGLHKTEDNLSVAKRENASILMEENYKANYEGFDPNSPEAYIAFSLFQNAFMSQSLNFASKIQTEFKEKTGRFSRGVKQAGFLVLYKTTMPSVLIETGFLTNPSEEKFLSSAQGQDHIASAVFRAFREYKIEKENLVARNNNVPNKGNEPLHAEAVKTSNKVYEAAVITPPPVNDNEAKAKAEAEKNKKELEEKTRLENEARLKAEAEAKARADEKVKQDATLKAKAEADAKARAKAEADAKAKAKAEADAKLKAKAEADAKARAEADRKKKVAEEAARLNAARAKKDAQARATAEEARKNEASEKARLEAEAKSKAWEDAKSKLENDAVSKLKEMENSGVESADVKMLITYSVQIGITSKALSLDDPFFKGTDKSRVFSENTPDGIKYTVGTTRKVSEAVSIQNEMRAKGFAGAFVVAYKNGKRITVQEAVSIQTEK